MWRCILCVYNCTGIIFGRVTRFRSIANFAVFFLTISFFFFFGIEVISYLSTAVEVAVPQVTVILFNENVHLIWKGGSGHEWIKTDSFRCKILGPITIVENQRNINEKNWDPGGFFFFVFVTRLIHVNECIGIEVRNVRFIEN